MPDSSARADGVDFQRDVQSVLEQYCVGCHGGKRPKAGVDLSKYDGAGSVLRDPDRWIMVADVVESRTMPPSDEPAPDEAGRIAMVKAVNALLDSIDDVRDPGHVTIGRLTRRQYNNTIRDLLGVDSNPADAFPRDGGGGGGFDNNASTLFVPPILMEKYLAVAAEVLDAAAPDRYLAARPAEGGLSGKEAARLVLERFASRAFRRPVRGEELDRLLDLYRVADERGEPFETAIKLPMRAVLVSPSFLFLVEQPGGPEEAGATRVSDFELASRLSYFLWSSMPDDELFELARQGKLQDEAVLEAQVRRMLADPKARALAEDFAGQWLRVDTLATAAEPDRRRYPDYTPELRDAMAEEAITFFAELLKNDRPILDLIDADYTYVNEPLAKLYGLEGVSGPEFRRVELIDKSRGGVLGMAGVLTLTSYPRRTSPVLRGKWVLEELLGTPPPPPPPMIKALPQDDRPREGLTFRQRLEKHRQDRSCASCHAKMDPLGFGLENFDAIGRWRDQIADEPVDASGLLTTGETFTGPAELKRILLESKRDLFVRNLTERMLAYALRRGLEYFDAPTVKQISGELESEGYRVTTLVAAIARSFPFRYQRSVPIAGE
jgi:hypothetical protein